MAGLGRRLDMLSTLRVLAVLAYAGGLGFRYLYLLRLHHPRHYVVSDAAGLMAVAQRFLQAAEVQTIWDTVWPPGAPALLALLAGGDPGLQLAAWFQLALAALVPLLIAHATWLAAGRRAAELALIFASLHFGFIHYGGFVLSEQVFQFAVSLAFWSSVVALQQGEHTLGLGLPRRRERWLLAAYGGASGAAWAFASSVRPNALPVVASSAALVALFGGIRGKSRYLPLLAGAVLAGLLGLAPLADRCSRLSGAFCPVSNNVAMNVALGQAGEVNAVFFRNPSHPELDSGWAPPALLQHGYPETRIVPFSIFDTKEALLWVWHRFLAAPHLFLLRGIGNALDLFRLEYWPEDYGGLSRRLAVVLKEAFLLGVVVPGLFGCCLCLRRTLRSRTGSALSLWLAVLPLGLCWVAALSLGEPRYRIPFDGVFVLFAAALYVRAAPGARRRPVAGGHTWLLAFAGVLALLALVLVALVSHPQTRIAARWFDGGSVRVAAAMQERRSVADFALDKAAGDAWNSPGSYVFECEPTCPELLVALEGPLQSERIELAVDSNDAYQVTFYREGQTLGHRQFGPATDGSGLRLQEIDVRESATEGFDGLGILPLYGDGRYSVGHVRRLDGP